MFVEITSQQNQPSRFAFQDITATEAEIYTEALVLYKSKLDAEEFKDVRRLCMEMFQKIDAEIIKTR